MRFFKFVLKSLKLRLTSLALCRTELQAKNKVAPSDTNDPAKMNSA